MKLLLDKMELLDDSGNSIPIRAKALELLCFLAAHKNSVVSRESIGATIWPDTIVTDDSISQCIVVIRKALKDDDRSVLETIPRRGYRINTNHAPTLKIESNTNDQQHQVENNLVPDVVTAKFTNSYDGTRLAYAINGSGPVLLRAPHWMTHVVHEWNDCVFGPRLRSLAKELAVARYDGRGFGLSERSVSCGTEDDWVADMNAVVEAANLQNFAVTGNSGGAPTALKYAATCPERLSCLVILGGFMRGALSRGIDKSHVEAFSQLIRDGWAGKNPAFRQLMSTQLFPDATPEQLLAFDDLQKAATDGKTAASLITRLASVDISDCLPKIRVPTLILHSEHDERQPFEQAVEMANLIPKAELHVMQTRNHVPLMNEPEFDRVIRITIDFVKNHTSPVSC